MLSLDRRSLRGTWASVMLPLGTNDEILWDRLEEEVSYLLESGVDGIYTSGTAGEFYAIDEKEYLQLNHMVVNLCEAVNKPCQLGASHMSGQISIDRIRSAAALGPSAIQVILPDWFPLSDDEVLDSMKRFASVAGSVPLVLYNPPHAKTLLDPLALGRLAGSSSPADRRQSIRR